MGRIRRAIGLMSGTSMDGIDIAALETDGDASVRRLASTSAPYDAAFRSLLREGLAAAAALVDRGDRPGPLAALERDLTERHAAAAEAFLDQCNWPRHSIDVIGFHGQTVLHRPDAGLTVQLGDGPLLSALLAIPVVYDLRAADIAGGGQGAPLAPVYHRAMAAKLEQRPVAVVNIGGVANITWIGEDDRLIAFDTGPGNAPIDDWMLRHTGQACDPDGAMAATGSVCQSRLDTLIAHHYFARLPPKTLDRNAFDLSCIEGLSLADGAATLTAFTAAGIAKAAMQVPQEPALWVVCGGGRRNRTLLSMLAGAVENAVVPAEAIGFDGDAVEAEAWAYLAVRALDGRDITYPGTTGIDRPMTGGVVVGSSAR